MTDPKQGHHVAHSRGIFISEGDLTVGDVSIHQARNLADEATEHYHNGVRHLERRNYQAAQEALTNAIHSGLDDPEAHFHRAVCRLAGRQPRRLRLPEIREIEDDLRMAADSCPGSSACLFWALVKQDYYGSYGLRDSDPPLGELLEAAGECVLDPEALKNLLRHLPRIEGEVYRLIQTLASK